MSQDPDNKYGAKPPARHLIKTALVTRDELANYFSVSPRTIDRWVVRGLVDRIEISPRIIRYNLQDAIRSVTGKEPTGLEVVERDRLTPKQIRAERAATT